MELVAQNQADMEGSGSDEAGTQRSIIDLAREEIKGRYREPWGVRSKGYDGMATGTEKHM